MLIRRTAQILLAAALLLAGGGARAENTIGLSVVLPLSGVGIYQQADGPLTPLGGGTLSLLVSDWALAELGASYLTSPVPEAVELHLGVGVAPKVWDGRSDGSGWTVRIPATLGWSGTLLSYDDDGHPMKGAWHALVLESGVRLTCWFSRLGLDLRALVRGGYSVGRRLTGNGGVRSEDRGAVFSAGLTVGLSYRL
jgi:hypothetical protein